VTDPAADLLRLGLDSPRARQLVLGLLARQAGAVEQTALKAGVGAWIRAGRRGSLADTLLARGDLGQDQAQALEALATAQLERHGLEGALTRLSANPELLADLLALLRSDPESETLDLPPRPEPRPEPPPEPEAPTLRYSVGEEIGRGGLGRVLSARDAHLDREVALKVLDPGVPDEGLARFHYEGRVTGRLQHPHIVPVYDLGSLPGPDAARPFFAMKRIQGRDMGQVIRALREGDPAAEGWTQRRLVEALRDVSHAIGYAHAEGVIHRDLKPANVMLGEFGEVLVVDWGLAKVVGVADQPAAATATPMPQVNSRPWVTEEGVVMGTPAYMAPEQAAGASDVDERTDIYGLGAILYEILTQERPFAGETTLEVLRKVASGELVTPAERRTRPDAAAAADWPEVPHDLDAVCRTAMARDPALRYPSAARLADELTAWLEGVRQRERRERVARDATDEARRLLDEHREQRARAQQQQAEVTRLRKAIPFHAPADEKQPLWEAEAAHRDACAKAAEAEGGADAAFGAALAAVPDHPAARAGKCELILQRYLEAERAGERDQLLLLARAIEQYDTDGAPWRARLRARGRIMVRTRAYACLCLAPLAPDQAARLTDLFGGECDLAWRDGGPAPGVELAPEDLPVPALGLPDGVTWGHGPACRPADLDGVRLRLRAWVEHAREPRLILGPAQDLPPAPWAAPLELDAGSYMLEAEAEGFAPLLASVRVDRDGLWEQDLVLYRPDELPDGFVVVPGGSFRFGPPRHGARWADERVTRDVFLARLPVSLGEYLAFLHDLPPEEASRRQPRDGEKSFLIEEDTRLRFPREGEATPFPVGPDTPALGISWHDALAYCAWTSRRLGRVVRLPHDLEAEKAARGVDGRTYTWGEAYDGTYSNTIVSHPGGGRPAVLDAFPGDLSPYGLRHVAGNTVTWCLNAGDGPYRNLRLLRGAAFNYSPKSATTHDRAGIPPEAVRSVCGLRLAISPFGC
jgi:eukaryotic-like serine/threonine-protein kinase